MTETPSNSASGSPSPKPQPGAEVLPPVQPPTSGFLLQLFFIPLLIVLIIVVVWMLFSWLAHMGSTPQELVKELSRRNNASWQRAVTLAEMLDAAPTGAEMGLRRDRVMAGELARILKEVYESGAKDEASIKLQEYLCSALGKFEVEEGIEALVLAAAPEKEEALLPVRLAAVSGLAELVSRLVGDPQLASEELERLRANADLQKRLIETTRDIRDSSETTALRVDEIRSRAAFTLGLIGGAENLDRLAAMLSDRSSNARNNATFGLARYGDARALPGIQEMLDPTNEAPLMHEGIDVLTREALGEEEAKLNKDWKRSQVLLSGLNTAKLLISRNRDADLTSLEEPIEALTKVELEFFRESMPARQKEQMNQEIRNKAIEVRELLKRRSTSG